MGCEEMGNINKLTAMVSFIAVAAFFLTACEKTRESGNKYPRDFPKECVAAFDRHALFIEKVRSSGKFDEESINEREKRSFDLLENFKNPPRGRTPDKEEYITACNIMDNLTLSRLKGVEHINSLSNEELERVVGVYLKKTSR